MTFASRTETEYANIGVPRSATGMKMRSMDELVFREWAVSGVTDASSSLSLPTGIGFLAFRLLGTKRAGSETSIRATKCVAIDTAQRGGEHVGRWRAHDFINIE